MSRSFLFLFKANSLFSPLLSLPKPPLWKTCKVLLCWVAWEYTQTNPQYRGADKSLARAGRKQGNVSVGMAWISFGALPCKKKKLYHSSRFDVVEIARVAWHASELVSFLIGLRTYQHPGRITVVSGVRKDALWQTSGFVSWNSEIDFSWNVHFPAKRN